MRTVILSDHLQSRIDEILPAGQQKRYDAEYEEAQRAAEQQQKRLDAEHKEAQRAAEQQQKRLDAEHKEAQRAAEQQQKRYDAEYPEAQRKANARQEIYDAQYEAAKRAADERDREIASVRMDAVIALRRMRLWRGLRLLVCSMRLRGAPRPEREIAPPPIREIALPPTRRTATTPRRKIAPQPRRTIAPTRLSQGQANELQRLKDSQWGEQQIPKILAEHLANTWTLMQGYRNNKGEVDFVLVGPPGICAIEVKFHNGTVFAESDGSWCIDRYHPWGDFSHTDPMRDEGGRSPGQQVLSIASELERFLRGRVPERHVGVRTAVILTNERARVGEVNTRVDVVATLRDLNPFDLVPAPGAGLSSAEVDKLVELIRQDHRFHEERMGRRGRTRGRRRGQPANSRRN